MQGKVNQKESYKDEDNGTKRKTPILGSAYGAPPQAPPLGHRMF